MSQDLPPTPFSHLLAALAAEKVQLVEWTRVQDDARMVINERLIDDDGIEIDQARAVQIIRMIHESYDPPHPLAHPFRALWSISQRFPSPYGVFQLNVPAHTVQRVADAVALSPLLQTMPIPTEQRRCFDLLDIIPTPYHQAAGLDVLALFNTLTDYGVYRAEWVVYYYDDNRQWGGWTLFDGAGVAMDLSSPALELLKALQFDESLWTLSRGLGFNLGVFSLDVPAHMLCCIADTYMSQEPDIEIAPLPDVQRESIVL